MTGSYQPLEFSNIPVGVSYAKPPLKTPVGLTLDSPAIEAMTDLREITALTVERTNTLKATRERMRKLGVRMLLVTGATGSVMGVITVTDLDSGRAEKIAAKTGEAAEDLLVQDIMTLTGRIEVLRLADIEQASVGDLLVSLRAVRRRHGLVVWSNPGSGEDEICGILSLTRTCAYLGLKVSPGDSMETIETALAEVLGNG
jgi:CBS-domain-containing membrane protein